jgi:hypothetical protein
MCLIMKIFGVHFSSNLCGFFYFLCTFFAFFASADRKSRYIRYRDNIGYPRYGEIYNIGDNQYSSKNLSYCPINRFLKTSSSSLSPPKTPIRSYSSPTPPHNGNPTQTPLVGLGRRKLGRGMGGQNGPQDHADCLSGYCASAFKRRIFCSPNLIWGSFVSPK